MMWNWGPGFGWGTMMVGGLMMLAFWVVVIVLAFLAFRAFSRSGDSKDGAGAVSPPEDSAMAALRERYAKGEISREQYQEMRDELKR